MNLKDLAAKLPETVPPSKTWIYHLIRKSEFKISTPQQIEFDRRHSCNVAVIYFYHMLHQHLFERPPSHILNMDETMLTAKRRLKVLARKGRLPLIPEAVKVPNFTGCVTFTASGHLFDPLIILPNKKTLRTLIEYSGISYFAGTMAGWQTSNTFIYYCLLLVCQISSYRLTLPEKTRNERFLLLVDGHPSRFTFKGCLILYLFDIDLVLLPPHTSHLLQPFDVAVAASLKTNFKEELITERFDSYVLQGIDISKQTAVELRNSMIKSFINALRKSSSLHNIESSFRKSGILPLNVMEPLKSQFAIDSNTINDNESLLRNYWLNCESGLAELFQKENGHLPTESDFDINLVDVLKDLKNASIEEGKALSTLPPLIIEDNGVLKTVCLDC